MQKNNFAGRNFTVTGVDHNTKSDSRMRKMFFSGSSDYRGSFTGYDFTMRHNTKSNCRVSNEFSLAL